MRVRATTTFSNSRMGTKHRGQEFEYDLAGDPARIARHLEPAGIDLKGLHRLAKPRLLEIAQHETVLTGRNAAGDEVPIGELTNPLIVAALKAALGTAVQA